MKIPTISAKNLWHWGTLQSERKFEAGKSWEGNLFSMSACPEAWRAIGRFGGYELHVQSDPTVMLDMRSVLHGTTSLDKGIRNLITLWALERKLLEYTEIFQISWFDDELDENVTAQYRTQEEAEIERGDEEDDYKIITSSIQLISTSTLNLRHGFRANEIHGMEFAVIDWAKEHIAQHVMGVYWTGRLDPLAYTAPKAGIFDITKLNLSSTDVLPDDEDGLKGVSGVKWIDIPQLDNHSSIQP
jgi:hypothetical protein